MIDDQTTTPVFVPVALRLEDARALCAAGLSVSETLSKIGCTDRALLSGVLDLAAAIDRATGAEE